MGGFVITVDSEVRDDIVAELERRPGVSLYGSDEQGNVVAVLESDSSKEMEKMTKSIQKIDGVLSLGMTYLNVEDEVEKSDP
ncbi:MAG: chaperone NapD [Thermodesulfobacteriota bacterium]|nr:chaperone NapD [Thermodesulfobacteriota bacterium]